MIRILGVGLVTSLFFLVVAGVGLAVFEARPEFVRGFCYGAVLCSIFGAWLGPKIGRPE